MRLLVVEDDPALAAALNEGLAAQGFALDRAPSAEGARDLLAVNPYDAIVLDLGLPGADGLTLVENLRERQNPIPILILTARSAVADRVAGLNAGADDYLQKPFAFPELVARLRALLRRGTPVAPTVLVVADLEVDPGRFAARRAGVALVLTAKEFAILEYLVCHAGELVTRSALLEHCWDESYDGLSNLVDVHVSRLRRKLEVGSGPALLHTVRGAGFILEERLR
jgi:DNA-binding response OmpR family regulator